MLKTVDTNPEIKKTEIPELRDVLVPCPICGGTTDIDLWCHIVCCSCNQKWKITGEPIVYEYNTQDYQLI